MGAFFLGYGVVGMMNDTRAHDFISDHFSNFSGSMGYAAMFLASSRTGNQSLKRIRSTIFCIGLCVNIAGEFVPPSSGFDPIDVLAGAAGIALINGLDYARERRLRKY